MAVDVSDDAFQQLIDQALGELPGEHARSIENIAILYDSEPTIEQRQQSHLGANETLLGLYEGVPLSKRQGTTRLYPDRITLFKGPLSRRSATTSELKEHIKHTLWHEIAHYYGLDHRQIHDLE